MVFVRAEAGDAVTRCAVSAHRFPWRQPRPDESNGGASDVTEKKCFSPWCIIEAIACFLVIRAPVVKMEVTSPISDSQLEKLLARALANADIPSTLFSAERIVCQLLDRDQWNGARKLIDRIHRSQPRLLDANRKIVAYKQARQLEVDENFEDALKYYEISSTEASHAARIILKLSPFSAVSEISDYLTSRPPLHGTWNESLLAAIRGRILDNDHANEIDADRRSSRADASPKLSTFSADLVPRQMREFLSDSHLNKWSNKKTLDLMKTIGHSLDPSVRSAMAENAILYHGMGRFKKACDLYLCLDLPNPLIDTLTRILEPASVLKFVCQFGYSDELFKNLIDYVHHINKRQTDENEATLFMAYLKLGLADEALQVLVTDCSPDEQIINEAVRYLDENLHKDSHKTKLFDPVLKRTTLIQVQQSLLNDQTISGHIITMIILISNAFLYKLDFFADANTESESISKLEIIFKRLSKSLKGLNFNTSDTLVRATNSMVCAVKDRLDTLAGSSIIRDAFKSLVETIAGRCMLEGRYKSAAALYSQIEDNMSAIKSLMRLGDAEIVINFSLLVRDIVVNRLTINYLKHLNLDPKVIEDFIAKSRL